MEYALLRSLRALGPGLILLSYYDLFRIFVLCDQAFFWKLESAKFFLIAYVVGGVYGVAAAYLKRDLYAFKGVNETILSALTGFSPEVTGRTWGEISPCFYKIIDGDKSLVHKSQGMYFNGFIVTTSFDSIWISFLSVAISAIPALSRNDWVFLLISSGAVISSFFIWRLSVSKHCDLAKNQVNVIRRRFSEDFRACVRKSLAS